MPFVRVNRTRRNYPSMLGGPGPKMGGNYVDEDEDSSSSSFGYSSSDSSSSSSSSEQYSESSSSSSSSSSEQYSESSSSSSYEAPLAQYCVTGAITPVEGLGTYVEDGVYDGKPYYTNGTYFLFWGLSLIWSIGHALGTTPIYWWAGLSGATPFIGNYPWSHEPAATGTATVALGAC